MSPKEKRKVRLEIANPLPGGNSIISLYHAERYVRRGDACFDAAGRLVFTIRTTDTLIAAEVQLLRQSGRGYDLATAIGLATRKELKHIPIVCPDKVLNCGRKRHKGGQTGE